MAKPSSLPDLTLNEQELMGTYSEFVPAAKDMLQSFHPEKAYHRRRSIQLLRAMGAC
jgi:hypothetical protein